MKNKQVNAPAYVWCVVIALTILSGTGELQAQSTCKNRSTDAFTAARRTRRALEDFERVNAAMQRDLSLLSTGDQTHALEHPLNLRVYAGPSGEFYGFPSLDVCTNKGATDGSLSNTRIGVVAGIDELKWGFSLRYIYSEYITSLSGAGPLSVSGPQPESEAARIYGADSGQKTHAVRLQTTRWFALTLGTILYNPIVVNGADDGTRVDVRSEPGRDHVFVRAEVPAVGASFDVVLGDARQDIETLYLDINKLRLGALPVEVRARMAYLADERRYYAVLGANWVHDRQMNEEVLEFEDAQGDLQRLHQKGGASYRLGADLAPEFGGFALRYAQARASVRYIQFSSYIEDNVSTTIIGSSYFDARASMFASVYSGQFMREQTNSSFALGAGVDGSVGLGFRAMSIHLGGTVGINRPETLSRLVQATDAIELGIQLRGRVGF